jgi:ATP-dependent DNA ligase
MADQLSLRLDPELPHLPVTIRPMTARPADAPFDSAEHLFEPHWGGERALAFIDRRLDGSRALRLLDGRGRELATLVPELGELPERISAKTVVLDGEIVVVDGRGRGDDAALRARLAGKSGPAVAYLVFDLLHLDGRPLFNEPLSRRREMLGRVLSPGDEVVAVPAIRGEGRALYEAILGQGIAGVMAREVRSPYLPGVRSTLWRLILRGSAGANPAGAATERDAGPGTDVQPSGEPQPGAGRSGPVIALIRRLPLDDPPGR